MSKNEPYHTIHFYFHVLTYINTARTLTPVTLTITKIIEPLNYVWLTFYDTINTLMILQCTYSVMQRLATRLLFYHSL